MDLKFEGVNFNVDYNAGLTEEDFVKAGKENETFKKFGENEEKMLKDAYKAIKEAKNPPAPAPDTSAAPAADKAPGKK